jgi:proteasome lid subunit RPN8/RPN11
MSASGFRPLPATVRDVRLTEAVQRALEDAARSPVEHCGGLVGTVHRRSLAVTHVLPCNNREARRDAFTLSVGELFARHGRSPWPGELIGIYHSHPKRGAVLSPLDIHYLSLYPWLWLVVARPYERHRGVRVAAYVRHGGRPLELICRPTVLCRQPPTA